MPSIEETELENTGEPLALRRRRRRIYEVAAVHDTAASARVCSYRAWIVTDSSTFVPPFTSGGTERQLSDLARELELFGAEVTVVGRETHEPTFCAPQPPDDLRTRYVPPAPVAKGMGWAALGPNVRYILATFRHLMRARREYDVLIVSGFRQIGLPVALLARIVRKPCLMRVDAAWDLNDELTPESNARIGPRAQRLVRAVIRTARRLTFDLSNRLVAFSDPLERRLVELGAAPKKIEKIPNGVDTDRFAPAAPKEKMALRRSLGLPTDRAIFIYTGRICRAKGLLELMSVWERMVEHEDLYLLLVGSGAHTHESCEVEVREAVARYPDSMGWCAAVDNVSQYLQAADVFIFLSYFESFGLSIVEAAAAGLPCIVSDVGCARQAVRHRESGAIVPPRAAPAAVLREIDWILEGRDRWPAMGALGRANVVNTFDLQTVARRYIGLFETLGAHSRPQTPRAL
ncbi:MAG: glycosyltransferase family 4 protein [Steroidobacteraceae bacterium]